MTEFEYLLKRSSRRSICVKIGADNSIEVTAPFKASVAEIERFLFSKRGWIEKHIKQNNGKLALLSDVIALKKILVTGYAVPLNIGEKDLFCKDFVAVKDLSHLKKIYVDNLGGQFLKTFNDIKSQFRFSCGNVSFRDYKSRWGSCFESGNIVFNYKLLMLPEDVQIYVMVHELCHTHEMNHSPKFYEEVARILPDYKLMQKKLKRFSPIVGLY